MRNICVAPPPLPFAFLFSRKFFFCLTYAVLVILFLAIAATLAVFATHPMFRDSLVRHFLPLPLPNSGYIRSIEKTLI